MPTWGLRWTESASPLSAGETRFGLNAYHLVGSGETCETWDSVDGMLDQAEEVEAAYGREVGIDIQSFPRFLEELGYD